MRLCLWSLASKIFCALGLEPCVLDSTSAKYLTKRFHQSLFLTPTTSFEVFNIMSGLKNTKSNSKKNISAYFLKVAVKIVAAPLAQLFNYTFLLEIFLALLKIAKIVPIYKSGDKSDVSNYRTIFMLSQFLKFLKNLFMSDQSFFSINTQSCCPRSMDLGLII